MISIFFEHLFVYLPLLLYERLTEMFSTVFFHLVLNGDTFLTIFNNLTRIGMKMGFLTLLQSFPACPSWDFSGSLRFSALSFWELRSLMPPDALSIYFYTCIHPVIFSCIYFSQTFIKFTGKILEEICNTPV